MQTSAYISTAHTHTHMHSTHPDKCKCVCKPARLSNLICANQLTKQMIRLFAHSHRWSASLIPLPASPSPTAPRPFPTLFTMYSRLICVCFVCAELGLIDCRPVSWTRWTRWTQPGAHMSHDDDGSKANYGHYCATTCAAKCQVIRIITDFSWTSLAELSFLCSLCLFFPQAVKVFVFSFVSLAISSFVYLPF